jgi:hypothetical protein
VRFFAQVWMVWPFRHGVPPIDNPDIQDSRSTFSP